MARAAASWSDSDRAILVSSTSLPAAVAAWCARTVSNGAEFLLGPTARENSDHNDYSAVSILTIFTSIGRIPASCPHVRRKTMYRRMIGVLLCATALTGCAVHAVHKD